MFGFVFSEVSEALGWSSKAPVPLTEDSPLFYPYSSYGLPCINKSDFYSHNYFLGVCSHLQLNVLVLHNPTLDVTKQM